MRSSHTLGPLQQKNRKLREQFQEDAGFLQGGWGDNQQQQLFRGVTIFVNGYTVPSHQELKRLMAVHGGGFENYYYRDRVTHIVCNSVPDAKLKQLASERWEPDAARPVELRQ